MMNSNPYGLINLWTQGDVVTKLVALSLLTMSVLSWSVIILKSRQISRLQRQASIAGNAFWHSKSLDEGLTLFDAGADSNPFRTLAEDGINAASHHAQNHNDLHGTLNLSEWLTSCLRRSIENIAHTLQAGLSMLASIGSTAPFVGLFGTVWGIYHALVGIGVSGQASIDKVAGPVGEALIMTALGLAVAIPAVLGYNALTTGNKKILARVRNFAHDLHACLLTGARISHPAKPSERMTQPAKTLTAAGGRV
jgi:biopolymer transport protein ExbB